ncbi:hypothetical protein GH714_014142 [Hevea brasiliensis]|uniref:Plant bHLH transcription factor ACT-like domain-containing protein n=1 Tax=Hevea brasiliensis TaxID=3981 RepID=A0A6A6N1E9_HEVBR|nr:hypothetical protein GH714_014142 [Hevea brasiliensis]
MEAAQTSSHRNPLPMVTVETLEKGFLINVFVDRSCPGLLVSILEAFEELGLNVQEVGFLALIVFDYKLLEER